MGEKQQNEIIRWFENLNAEDVSVVGGKNASLGEMIRTLKAENIRVPDGFATTSQAYLEFLQVNGLKQKIQDLLYDLHKGEQTLEKVGKSIRKLFAGASFPEQTAQAPSDFPDFAEFLIQEGIDSISLNPDSVIETKKRIAQEEARRSKAR